MARLFYSGAIFSHFECSRGRKFIPNIKQICRGVEGFNIILKISLHISVNLKWFLKCSSKMSYFGLKRQIFLKYGEWESNILSPRAAKKVWRAACGSRAALWPCLLYYMFFLLNQLLLKHNSAFAIKLFSTTGSATPASSRPAVLNLGYAYPWGYARSSRGYSKC